jgi:hypothetical protein
MADERMILTKLPEEEHGLKRAPQSSPFETYEKAFKIGTACLAVFYGLGLLVSNQYLIGLGVTDFSSVKPKYILTGAWSVLLTMVASFPFLWPLLRRKNHDSHDLVYIRLVIGILASLVVSRLIYGALEIGREWHFKQQLIFIAVVSSISSYFFAEWMFREARRGRKGEDPWYHRKYTLIQYAVVGIMVTLALTRYMATHLYGTINEAMGGGKPVEAQLILTKDGLDTWSHLGGAISNGTPITLSQSVKILYQSEHELAVRAVYQQGSNSKERIVLLKRDLVSAILPGI